MYDLELCHWFDTINTVVLLKVHGEIIVSLVAVVFVCVCVCVCVNRLL
jgi:hypothetical protein